jgi:hypothetical protein
MTQNLSTLPLMYLAAAFFPEMLETPDWNDATKGQPLAHQDETVRATVDPFNEDYPQDSK